MIRNELKYKKPGEYRGNFLTILPFFAEKGVNVC